MSLLMETAKPEIQTLGLNEAQIVFGPLERGYGYTLGNALRRVLLSSIPGVAVVEVRIEGVQHECDTIEGVREDVIEILLNLKRLAVQMHGDLRDGDERELSLEQKGSGTVTAAQFQIPPDVQIANPELHVCTVSNDATELRMQVVVRVGRGYEPADQRVETEGEKAIGTLDVDATFSPISRVAYQVDQVRVAGQTDLDRLTLLLTTNGTVQPADVMGHAASLLRRQLEPLAELTKERDEPEKQRWILIESLKHLGLETRIINVLRESLKIEKVGELVQMTEAELLAVPRLAVKSVEHIKEVLMKNDLMLNMEIEWPPKEPPPEPADKAAK